VYSWSVKTTGKSKRGKSITSVYFSSSSSSSSVTPSLSPASALEAGALSVFFPSFRGTFFLLRVLENTLAEASTFCLCFSTALKTRLSSQSTRGISPISCFLNSFSSLSSSSSSGVAIRLLLTPFTNLFLGGNCTAGVSGEENPSAAL